MHERLLSERKRHASVCYITDGYRTLVVLGTTWLQLGVDGAGQGDGHPRQLGDGTAGGTDGIGYTAAEP